MKYINEYINNMPDNRNKIYLFPGFKGPLERRTVRKIVKYYGSLIDVNISPHTFRSSLATHIAENGGDSFDVKEQLGHAHTITCECYVKAGKDFREPFKYHPRT